ncbi:response regulator transcription factor [Protaetiibacter intestinalis]|uniref:DNA-binding response regulator n=1 Tax=Protaetiibacter intestinalis TaxID=2419774 RepID=A0A387B4Z3_9MICO|nr:response regulator transcription factor [Protaetiibacter intestinalis]AYF98744.1 DNA-binding response regulator [Protaetiibacter intestinalis]
MAAPIRLAVVDDHRMILSGLANWIRNATDEIDVVAELATWPELLTHPSFPVDVVLLDLDLKDNIPVAVKISALKSTGVRVVLMSTYSEPNVVREALAAGALGYLVKSEDAEMIVEAIRAAAQGESFVSAELDLAINASDIGGAPKLSAQERRVMALYGGGEPVKSVAYQLGISEETAKSYLKRIREKYRVAGIDVGTKVALRRRAIQDGILIQDAPTGSF